MNYPPVLKAAKWCVGNVDEVPFLGNDFAVTNQGVVLIEMNPLCSYSRYVHKLGSLYTPEECNDFLERMKLSKGPNVGLTKNEIDGRDALTEVHGAWTESPVLLQMVQCETLGKYFSKELVETTRKQCGIIAADVEDVEGKKKEGGVEPSNGVL